MSHDKTRARDARLAPVARAASQSGLLTGVSGFPPTNNRVIARLELEGLITRSRTPIGWGGRAVATIFHATEKGRAALAAARLAPSGHLPNLDPRPRAAIEKAQRSRRAHVKLAKRLEYGTEALLAITRAASVDDPILARQRKEMLNARRVKALELLALYNKNARLSRKPQTLAAPSGSPLVNAAP